MKAPLWKVEGVAFGTLTPLNCSDSHSTQPKVLKVPSTICAGRIKAKHQMDQYILLHARICRYVLAHARTYASAEYDSTQLLSTQSQGYLLHCLCQENQTVLEGSGQLESTLPACWAASTEQGGWICTHIPTRLETNSNSQHLAEPR